MIHLDHDHHGGSNVCVDVVEGVGYITNPRQNDHRRVHLTGQGLHVKHGQRVPHFGDFGDQVPLGSHQRLALTDHPITNPDDVEFWVRLTIQETRIQTVNHLFAFRWRGGSKVHHHHIGSVWIGNKNRWLWWKLWRR